MLGNWLFLSVWYSFPCICIRRGCFPMLTVTFNSQCVTDRVKLSGYRKFWLVKEKAEKKLKISITHIHFKFKTKYPATKTKKKKNHFWLMEHSILCFVFSVQNLYNWATPKYLTPPCSFGGLGSWLMNKSGNPELQRLVFVGGFEKPCWKLRPLWTNTTVINIPSSSIGNPQCLFVR